METELISWRDETGFLCDPTEQKSDKLGLNQNMSIPSKAKLYSKENVVLGEVFVNVGQYISALGLTRCIFDVFRDDIYKSCSCVSYVDIYDIKFTKEFIDDMQHYNHKEVSRMLKEILPDLDTENEETL